MLTGRIPRPYPSMNAPNTPYRPVLTHAARPATFTVERHNQSPFPLTGKHAAARCTLCHGESRFEQLAEKILPARELEALRKK